MSSKISYNNCGCDSVTQMITFSISTFDINLLFENKSSWFQLKTLALSYSYSSSRKHNTKSILDMPYSDRRNPRKKKKEAFKPELEFQSFIEEEEIARRTFELESQILSLESRNETDNVKLKIEFKSLTFPFQSQNQSHPENPEIGNELTKCDCTRKIITLETRDGLLFHEEMKVINKLGRIRNHILDTNNNINYVELNDVSSVTLFHAIEWAQYHKDVASPQETTTGENLEYELNAWEKRFLEFDLDSLLQLHEMALIYNIADLTKALIQAVSIRGLHP